MVLKRKRTIGQSVTCAFHTTSVTNTITEQQINLNMQRLLPHFLLVTMTIPLYYCVCSAILRILCAQQLDHNLLVIHWRIRIFRHIWRKAKWCHQAQKLVHCTNFPTLSLKHRKRSRISSLGDVKYFVLTRTANDAIDSLRLLILYRRS